MTAREAACYYYFDNWRITEIFWRMVVVVNEVFKALGDPTRREILRLLRDRDLSAGELAEHFPLAKSTLSGHFATLRHAGLIVQERRGTTIVYSLHIAAVEEVVAAVLGLLGVGEDGAADGGAAARGAAEGREGEGVG